MAEAKSPAGGSYQFILVSLLSVNFGILFLDRNALGFLIDFVKKDIALDNSQIGLLSSVLAFSWAISGFLVGRWSDLLGKRKAILIIATVGFSLCSVLSSFAASFVMLLAARLLMGVAEGGVLPVSQALVMTSVRPERRGLAMGVMQNFGSQFIGGFLAPIILTAVALTYGWRNAFFVAGIPGLICAALMVWLVRDPPASQEAASGQERNQSTLQALRHRNIWVCAIMAILMISMFLICLTFMKLFLVEVRQFDTTVAANLVGVLGLSAVAGSFVVPGLSDRYGRRPIMILTPLLGVVLPLAAMYWTGSPILLGVFFVIGWMPLGCFPLLMATIPSEAVGPRNLATALGLVMGLGEILGGVFGPYGAGLAADAGGLAMPLWIMLVLCVCTSALALLLKESAPRLVSS
jgi:ACS family hexuronate transporter-like MFS transporter